MEASAREVESRNVCTLLAYFMDAPPGWVKKAAGNYYGDLNRADEATRMLCELCQSLDESVIYNGRDPMARKLADWWDKHQEMDRKRAEAEETARKQQEARARAISKLSTEEAAALGIKR